MRRMFGQRVVYFHCEIDPFYMNQSIAMCARHLRINLRYHTISRLNRRPSRIDRYAQSAESMLVGRRYLNESRIERKDLFTKQRRHFAQEDGYIVGLSA